MKHTILGAALAMMLCFAVTADAQWLKTKTPGIPRTKDDKPNLTAPAPRTTDGKPDLSGIWQVQPLRVNVESGQQRSEHDKHQLAHSGRS